MSCDASVLVIAAVYFTILAIVVLSTKRKLRELSKLNGALIALDYTCRRDAWRRDYDAKHADD